MSKDNNFNELMTLYDQAVGDYEYTDLVEFDSKDALFESLFIRPKDNNTIIFNILALYDTFFIIHNTIIFTIQPIFLSII